MTRPRPCQIPVASSCGLGITTYPISFFTVVRMVGESVHVGNGMRGNE